MQDTSGLSLIYVADSGRMLLGSWDAPNFLKTPSRRHVQFMRRIKIQFNLKIEQQTQMAYQFVLVLT